MTHSSASRWPAIWIPLTLASAALALAVSSASPAADATPEVPAIAERPATDAEVRLLDNVKYLASDELEGRGVGTQGLVRAGEYVREEFRKAGLDVSRVENGPFQKFSMVTGS